MNVEATRKCQNGRGIKTNSPPKSKLSHKLLSIVLSLIMILSICPLQLVFAADGVPDFAVTDSNGLAGLSFDVPGVDCSQEGTTISINVPNGSEEIEVSFTADTDCLVGTGTKVTGMIRQNDITPVSSKKITMSAQGVTDTINAYKPGRFKTYTCTVYTLNFSYLNEEFRITQDVGERRFIYDKNADATAIFVGAAAPEGEIITYQWLKSVDGKTYSDVAGETEASFAPPTDNIGKTLYRVKVSNGTDTYESGKVIVDIQDPDNPSRAWALRELVIASQESDDGETVYLSEQPWTTNDLEYTFTIPDTEITKQGENYAWVESFWFKAVTADSSYPLSPYYINPGYGATSPTTIWNKNSGEWAKGFLTANGDPIAKVRVGPDAKAFFGATNYLEYIIRARIKATLEDLNADETMTPTFSPDVTEYSAEIPADQETVTITAPPRVEGNPVMVNGEAIDENGSVSLPIVWNSENKMIVTIKVGTDLLREAGTQTVSNTYTLTLNKEQSGETPVINVHPKNASYTDVEGNPAALYVRAHAIGTLSYQWYRNTENQNTDGEKIEGANFASFVPEIAPINTREDKTLQEKITYYYCEVSANGNTVVSRPAAVTLIPDPTPYDVRIVAEDGSEIPAGGYNYNQGETATNLKCYTRAGTHQEHGPIGGSLTEWRALYRKHKFSRRGWIIRQLLRRPAMSPALLTAMTIK